jgi:hypothetical protein
VSEQNDQDYWWQHRAVETRPSLARELTAAVTATLRDFDFEPVRKLWAREEPLAYQRQWSEQQNHPQARVVELLEHSVALLESTSVADPDLIEECEELRQRARAALGAHRAKAAPVRRLFWERIPKRSERLATLISLGAPDVIVANELRLLAHGVEMLAWTPMPEPPEAAPCPLVEHQAYEDDLLADGSHTVPDLWEIVNQLSFWSQGEWPERLGLQNLADRLPRMKAFHDAHPQAWPTTLSNWDMAAYRTDREERVLDVYPDGELWRPAALTLPTPLVDLDVALDPRAERIFVSGDRIGAGEHGGPITWAEGEALIAHGEVAAAEADKCEGDDQLALALRTFGETCVTFGGQGRAVMSWLVLNAPRP